MSRGVDRAPTAFRCERSGCTSTFNQSRCAVAAAVAQVRAVDNCLWTTRQLCADTVLGPSSQRHPSSCQQAWPGKKAQGNAPLWCVMCLSHPPLVNTHCHSANAVGTLVPAPVGKDTDGCWSLCDSLPSLTPDVPPKPGQAGNHQFHPSPSEFKLCSQASSFLRHPVLKQPVVCTLIIPV